MKIRLICILAVVAAAVFICIGEAAYIDASAEKLITQTDRISAAIEAQNESTASEEILELNAMWDENVKNWQALQPHDIVGEVYDNLFFLNRYFESGDIEMTKAYLTLTKYSIWDIYTLNKVSFENIF